MHGSQAHPVVRRPQSSTARLVTTLRSRSSAMPTNPRLQPDPTRLLSHHVDMLDEDTRRMVRNPITRLAVDGVARSPRNPEDCALGRA